MPTINAAGLALIKEFEGCRLTSYQDSVGVWTIGWGHTGIVSPGETISQEHADALLMGDLAAFEQCVNDATAVDLTPNQFAALVSFAYNLGCGALKGSTLMRLVNARNWQGAADQFQHWVYAGGISLPGLVRRRLAERTLFLTP